MVETSQFPANSVAQETECSLNMLAAIFADMGGWDHTCVHVKEACRLYAVSHLIENPGLSASDLQSGLQYFREGYLQALADFGT